MPAEKTPTPKPSAFVLPDLDSFTSDMNPSDLERMERLLAVRRALREEQEHEDKLEENRRARKAGIENTRQAMASLALKQQMCAHKKENGRTNLAGQRDHDGVVHLICQMCQRAYLGNDVPFDLRPMMETVGGPNN